MRYLTAFTIFLFFMYPAISISEDTVKVDIEKSYVQELDLEISLFESVEIVKDYIKEKNVKLNGMYLHSITLQYMEGHPKKDYCWHYAWNHKKPRIGGEMSLYHFMDGVIQVQHHGP